MNNIMFKSNNNVSRQIGLLVISIIFILIDIGFLVVEFNIHLIWVLIFSFVFLAAANYLVGILYDVVIDGDLVVARSLWCNRQFKRNEIENIERVNFILYYPLNPYIKFKLTSNRTIVTTLPEKLKIYFAEGGVKGYLDRLKRDIDI